MLAHDLTVLTICSLLVPAAGCGSSCATLDSTADAEWPNGVGAGVACAFPFVYNGVSYGGCTDADTPGKRWCATAGYTAATGYPWGWCACDESKVPPVCCTAQTAKCLACSAGVTVHAYCHAHPEALHCDAIVEESRGCAADLSDREARIAGGTSDLYLGGMGHKLTLPADYAHGTASKALLYFHGWGGSSTECGAHCSTAAAAAGFVTVALSGYSGAWANAGSAVSAEHGATCHPDTPSELCPADCSAGQCSGSDGCWWTTCRDSVGPV
jgi:hypothetical protein